MSNNKYYRFEKVFPLPRAKVWELMSNTEHLNRTTGVFSVSFSPAQFLDQSMFRYADAKVAGLVPVRWREYPFEWVRGEVYSVERVYETGPIKRFHWTIELHDRTEGDQPMTAVVGIAHFTVKPLGHLAVPLKAVPSAKKIVNYAGQYLRDNQETIVEVMPRDVKKPQVDEVRLKRLSERVTEADQSSVKALVFHLMHAADDEVKHMRPYELADRWNLPRKEVLAAFLYATKAGMLLQSWNLMCPNCRVPKETVSTLKDVKNHVHCDLCGVGYDMNFDRYVEMRFEAHPSIRTVAGEVYCVGGPLTSPHILSQHRIPPHAEGKVRYSTLESNMRIRLLKKNHAIDVATVLHETAPSLVFNESGWSDSSLELTKAGGTFEVRNETGEEIIVIVETKEWDGRAVTAADVTSLQLFRTLFSKEVVAPDQQVGVESLTILFSDLKGSTSLYESVGDAGAYQQVYHHFDYLRNIISRYDGTIVKTIGDSVMAAFYKPENAFLASLEIQAGIRSFNETYNHNLVIKLGLYTGPTIAVNANDLLDYFGHTVNLAARIQQQSQGDDIMISVDEWHRESFRVIADRYVYQSRTFSAVLSGIQEEVGLIQLSGIHANQAALEAAPTTIA